MGKKLLVYSCPGNILKGTILKTVLASRMYLWPAYTEMVCVINDFTELRC